MQQFAKVIPKKIRESAAVLQFEIWESSSELFWFFLGEHFKNHNWKNKTYEYFPQKSS